MKSVYFLRKSHIFILMGTHPFSKHLVKAYYAPDSVLGAREDSKENSSWSLRITMYMVRVITESGQGLTTPPQGR